MERHVFVTRSAGSDVPFWARTAVPGSGEGDADGNGSGGAASSKDRKAELATVSVCFAMCLRV